MLTMTLDDIRVEQTLGRAGRFLNDFYVPERILNDVIAARVEHRFQTGDNGQWQDITPETRKRRKGDKTAPPGTDIGTMRAAATATREGVPFSLLRFDPDGLTMGVDTEGAAAFQYGSEDGSQPPRPFLEIYDEDIAIAMDRYGALLTSVIGGL